MNMTSDGLTWRSVEQSPFGDRVSPQCRPGDFAPSRDGRGRPTSFLSPSTHRPWGSLLQDLPLHAAALDGGYLVLRLLSFLIT